MTLIKAENRELTHSRYQSTKGIPATNPKTRGTGLLLGTDFRHAVEFSRCGRARTPAFRPSFEAAFPRYATRRDGQAPGLCPWPSRVERRRSVQPVALGMHSRGRPTAERSAPGPTDGPRSLFPVSRSGLAGRREEVTCARGGCQTGWG